jgi:hypothetical protein
MLNTKYALSTAHPLSALTALAACSGYTSFHWPIRAILKYTQKQAFILLVPLFSCHRHQGYQTPATFKDNKRPIPDQNRCITGKTGSNNIEKDIQTASL